VSDAIKWWVTPLAFLKRLFLVFAAFLLTAALPGTVPPRLDQEPDFPSLVGQVLVALPDMGDPRFQRTVILIVRHNKQGAFGITINRPIGDHSLASLLEMLGERDTSAEGDVRIFAGGPVQPEVGFVVHSAEYVRDETIAINDIVAVTSSTDVLRDISHHKGPRKTLVAFGYAGWAPGQLESELARDDWSTTTADSELIFEMSRDRVWESAMARRSKDL
jgi:putative transcriptional regulator